MTSFPKRQDENEKSTPGSPSPGEPVFLAVGKLRRAHGVQGEMIMEVLTDFPERLRPGSKLTIGTPGQLVRLRSVRPHNQFMLVSFEGYTDPERVRPFVNQLVQVPVDDRPPLPEGEYYQHQLIGLSVVDESGRSLGRVKQILETGANDVYIVQATDGKEILLPAIDPVILSIDLEEGVMRVHLLPGLLPD